MATKQISPGESDEIIARSDPMGKYEFEVRSGGPIKVGPPTRLNEARTFQTNQSGTIGKHQENERLAAKNEGGTTAEIYVRKTSFDFTLDPPITLNTVQQLQSQSGLTALNYATSSTNAEQLPSNVVPPGIEVLLWADPNNENRVFVGDSGTQSIPLPADGTLSLRVDNTDAIHLQTPNSGDAVGVLFEDG